MFLGFYQFSKEQVEIGKQITSKMRPLLFSYTNIWAYFRRVKIWETTPVFVPSCKPVWTHKTQHSRSPVTAACLSGQKPDISMTENTQSIKNRGGRGGFAENFQAGSFGAFLRELFWRISALHKARSLSEAWEVVLGCSHSARPHRGHEYFTGACLLLCEGENVHA